MKSFLQDLSYACRTLHKHPGFAAAAVLTVALAIGANTALFSFIKVVLLNPIPFPHSERIVYLREKNPYGRANAVSTLNYLDWVKQSDVFQYMSATPGWTATIEGGSAPIQIRGRRVAPHYFDIYGIRPALGRTFLPGDDKPGNDHVVVLSHALWVSRFGSDPKIVGRSILVDGQSYRVIGVLNPVSGNVFSRMYQQIWKPLVFTPSEMTRDSHWFGLVAKLKPGITLKQARADMDVIGRRLAERYPSADKGHGIVVDRLSDVLVGTQLRTAALALFGATALILLIGCANLTNLLLARGISRRRELALRASLGASHWRLARQLLTESVVVSVVGGLLGVVLAWAALKGMEVAMPAQWLPPSVHIPIDRSVMLFAFGLSLMTGLLFGVAPAIQGMRTDLVGSTKEGEQGADAGVASRRVRNGLVVAEVALTFVLLVGSGLLLRTLVHLLDVNVGFDSTNVLTAGLPLPHQEHAHPAEINAYLKRIRTAVAAVPGVQQTAITSGLPLTGGGYGMRYQIAGRPPVSPAHRPSAFFKTVSPSYFRLLRIKVLEGRSLDQGDTGAAKRVMVINHALAQRAFPNQDPVGQHLLVRQIIPGSPQLGREIPWEVVGVIADEKVEGHLEWKPSGMYASTGQSAAYGPNLNAVHLVVRTGIDPRRLENSIRSAVASVNKNQALAQLRTLDDLKSQVIGPTRMEALLPVVFASMALLLAALGIYGVLSYLVAQRTRELGVRIALGASSLELLGLVLRKGLSLTLAGLVAGLFGSLLLTRLLASMLYDVRPQDPLTLGVAAAVLLVVAVAACLVPARRAVTVDAATSLRTE